MLSGSENQFSNTQLESSEIIEALGPSYISHNGEQLQRESLYLEHLDYHCRIQIAQKFNFSCGEAVEKLNSCYRFPHRLHHSGTPCDQLIVGDPSKKKGLSNADHSFTG